MFIIMYQTQLALTSSKKAKDNRVTHVHQFEGDLSSPPHQVVI